MNSEQMDLWGSTPTTPNGASPSNALTVGELTRRICDVLEGGFDRFWIEGEVTNLRKQASGHFYFTLKDDEAQISCVLFRGDAARQEIKPENGRALILFGSLSVYPPRGNYQMIVRLVIESGAGRLQAEFERLKARLAGEGLFDAERKQALPAFPRRIAIVTSSTGAALQDFLSILRRRHFRGEVMLIPSAVQGDHAPGELSTGLAAALRLQPDVIVLTRGGGSMEDLWAFNDPSLVREVAAAAIPIISAVGHEIDFVLTDFAADQRAETPSGAAELLSSLQRTWLETFEGRLNRLRECWRFALQIKTSRFSATARGARLLSPLRRLERAQLDLDQAEEHLQMQTRRRLDDLRGQLRESSLQLSPDKLQRRLEKGSDQLTSLQSRLKQARKAHLRTETDRIHRFATAIEAFDHRRILNRGFALVRHADGTLLTSREAAASRTGESASLQFKDGSLPIRLDPPEETS